MNYQQTLDWLFSQLPMYQRVGKSAYKADLTNTHKLMDLLDHPENKFKSIHIAGTNGKGSVSHMLASVFQEAGYKTGLYTSPHLKDFRERIKINGKMVPETEVIDFVENHKSNFEDMGLSFFEMTVGMAFQHFAREKVDIAIVEVGLGGRLDSTNVINPELSIITNISLDHMTFLGDTIEAIAREKAGIIKEDTPILIGELQDETIEVFKEIAHERKARLALADQDDNTSNYGLVGKYQIKNRRTVSAAVKLLSPKYPRLKENLQVGLVKVVENTGIRGRWERIQDSPRVICDTGHNEAGVKEVVQQLNSEDYDQLHIVWGMVDDKAIESILKLLPQQATYYFCKPNIPRGMDAYVLADMFKTIWKIEGQIHSKVSGAIAAAIKNAGKEDLIFVGGSTFVVAEAL